MTRQSPTTRRSHASDTRQASDDLEQIRSQEQDDGSPFHCPGPFSPRYRVARLEVSDEDWAEMIAEEFGRDPALVPGTLPAPPPGLANIGVGMIP